MPTTSARPATPKRIDRYHVLRVLGEGGMGLVYGAYDPHLGRKVALKVLRTNDSATADTAEGQAMRGQVLIGARNLARLSHPNVVPIYDVGIADGCSIFLAIEYVEGQSLRSIFSGKRMPWRQKLALVLEAGDGLAAAHRAGLVHRDFKPENVMVGNDGGVRVLDFGIAGEHKASLDQALDEENLTTCGNAELFVGGTAAYMPPEQLRGPADDPRIDIFAFASVAYEAVCGVQPFPSGSPARRLQAIKRGIEAWPRNVPKWLRLILARALDYDPNRRGTSLFALLAEIRECLSRDERRKSWIQWTATLALPLSLFAIWQWQRDRSIDPGCEDVDREVASAWNSDMRTQVGRGFAQSKLPLADDLWRRSASALDQWRDEWTEEASKLCPTTRESLNLPPMTLHLRESARACLDESRAEVQTLLGLWKTPTLRQILDSPNALASLSSPAECLNTRSLSERAPLPMDPRLRQIVVEQRKILSEANVRISQADFNGALATVDSIAAPVLETGDLSSMARLFWQRALLAASMADGGVTAYVPMLRASLWTLAARRDQDLPVAAGRLWFSRAYLGGVSSESEDLSRWHEATVMRAGANPKQRSLLARNQGIWAATNGRTEESEAYFKIALEASREGFGVESSEYAMIYVSLGHLAFLQGKFGDALPLFESALEISSRLFGAGHPNSLRVWRRMSETHLGASKPIQAAIVATSAWNECRHAGLSDNACAVPAAALFRALMASGHFREAAALLPSLMQLEAEQARRTEPSDPWLETYAATLLRLRGENEAALAMANEGLTKLRAETAYLPGAIVLALHEAIFSALANSNVALANQWLRELEDALTPASETFDDDSAFVLAAQGEVWLANRDISRSLIALEALVDDAEFRHTPTPHRAESHLAFATALFSAHFLKEAKREAKIGFDLLVSNSDFSHHLRVPFRSLFTKIAIAEHRLDDAVFELGKLALDQDQREVSEEQFSELFFLLESQVSAEVALAKSSRR
jgi:serine/threonine protein kinase